jgi:calcineurin-like phosphoesterase family protein
MKLTLNKKQTLWFTSDTHYNHSNICSSTTNWKNSELITRKFNSLEEMNDKLVDNINHCIMEDDILIHLGDWSFGGFDSIVEFRRKINCKNIHLILGNHDHHIKNNKDNSCSLFSSVNEYMHLDLKVPNGELVDEYKFILMHYPIASWDGMNKGAIHLHGHVHLPPDLRIHDGKSMDVGVDGNELNPIELNEILDIMSYKPINKLTLPKDHHINYKNGK